MLTCAWCGSSFGGLDDGADARRIVGAAAPRRAVSPRGWIAFAVACSTSNAVCTLALLVLR